MSEKLNGVRKTAPYQTEEERDLWIEAQKSIGRTESQIAREMVDHYLWAGETEDE